MAQTTKKTTIVTVDTEVQHTPTVGAKTCEIKNRYNEAFQWSWNPGIVANGGNVIGPFCVLKNIPVPPGNPTLYVLGKKVNDVLEVEYT